MQPEYIPAIRQGSQGRVEIGNELANLWQTDTDPMAITYGLHGDAHSQHAQLARNVHGVSDLVRTRHHAFNENNVHDSDKEKRQKSETGLVRDTQAGPKLVKEIDLSRFLLIHSYDDA